MLNARVAIEKRNLDTPRCFASEADGRPQLGAFDGRFAAALRRKPKICRLRRRVSRRRARTNAPIRFQTKNRKDKQNDDNLFPTP